MTPLPVASTTPQVFLFAGASPYENNLNSCWLLSGAGDIQLDFTSMDIEAEAYCGFDYVEVYRGNDPELTDRVTQRLCGNESISIPNSSFSQSTVAPDYIRFLIIRFHSDDSVAGKGFALQYTLV